MTLVASSRGQAIRSVQVGQSPRQRWFMFQWEGIKGGTDKHSQTSQNGFKAFVLGRNYIQISDWIFLSPILRQRDIDL